MKERKKKKPMSEQVIDDIYFYTFIAASFLIPSGLLWYLCRLGMTVSETLWIETFLFIVVGGVVGVGLTLDDHAVIYVGEN